MASQVNIALVGYSCWEPNLARNIALLHSASLDIICDQNVARLAGLNKLYRRTRLGSDFQAVVADPKIDAVVCSGEA